MHRSCDVDVVLVMLLSGLRPRGPVFFATRGVGLGFDALAAFFSSLTLFRSFFSFSSLSFFSTRSLISFSDCSSVNMRENVVLMPLCRCAAGAGVTRREGGVKIDVIDWTGAAGEECGAEDEEDESEMDTDTGGTDGATYRDESSISLRSNAPSLYMSGVILVRSKGKMPDFSNPAMQLRRVVALSHAQRVALT
jgi:hypothetical protein